MLGYGAQECAAAYIFPYRSVHFPRDLLLSKNRTPWTYQEMKEGRSISASLGVYSDDGNETSSP